MNNTENLRKLAETYGMEDNPLFLSLIDQYVVQQKVIDLVAESLKECDLTTTKSYIKGTENVYANPLVKELPKHADSATRTAGMILNVIKGLGEKKTETDAFEDFLNDN